MGCKVTWTDSARHDVERTVRHVAVTLSSPQAAASLLDALDTAVEQISTFPEGCPVGQHHALRSRGLRKKLVKRYVMLYSYDGETATISRVFHTLQDYARVIAEE